MCLGTMNPVMSAARLAPLMGLTVQWGDDITTDSPDNSLITSAKCLGGKYRGAGRQCKWDRLTQFADRTQRIIFSEKGNMVEGGESSERMF